MKRRPFILGAAFLLAALGGCSLLLPVDGFTSPDIPSEAGPLGEPPVVVPLAEAGADAAPEPLPVDSAVPDAPVPPADSAAPTTHFLYAIGGSLDDNALFQDNVYYAPILDDGSIGDWDVTTPLMTGLRNHAAIVHGDDVFLIGGEYAGSILSADVHVAHFLPGGKLGPWKVLTDVLDVGRKDHTASVSGDHLYVSGGYDGQSALRSILHASLSADGGIGPVGDGGLLPDTTRLHATAVVNGYFFSGGGISGNGLYVPDVFALPMGAAGQLSAATKQPGLPIALAYHRMVTDGNTLYTIGGVTSDFRTPATPTSSVYMATAPRAGTLGSWTKLASFSGPRWRHGALIAYGNIYVVGGRFGDAPPFIADVQIGKIAADHTVTWRTSDKPLPRQLASHALVVH